VTDTVDRHYATASPLVEVVGCPIEWRPLVGSTVGLVVSNQIQDLISNGAD
jgi:hypothetical protein